jgi:hypothetical protein
LPGLLIRAEEWRLRKKNRTLFHCVKFGFAKIGLVKSRSGMIDFVRFRFAGFDFVWYHFVRIGFELSRSAGIAPAMFRFVKPRFARYRFAQYRSESPLELFGFPGFEFRAFAPEKVLKEPLSPGLKEMLGTQSLEKLKRLERAFAWFLQPLSRYPRQSLLRKPLFRRSRKKTPEKGEKTLGLYFELGRPPPGLSAPEPPAFLKKGRFQLPEGLYTVNLFFDFSGGRKGH